MQPYASKFCRIAVSIIYSQYTALFHEKYPTKALECRQALPHKLLLAYHIQRMFPLPQQLLSRYIFHRFTPNKSVISHPVRITDNSLSL